ncbi:hypothetical protein JTE90_022984 [Oedothorax gibbosus]|uniref:Delta-like protein n=1 Tax=Oedothorax gibbosus TaxID=931172 RepID=A0AAV6VAL5_9ARAC|nr:hypothetical protein JTE90_022984 [Oedothorax gibbosus]
MAMFFWCMFALSFHFASANPHIIGTFELEVLSIENYRGEIQEGFCCGGMPSTNGTCEVECKTAFHLCLKEYQVAVNPDSPCTYGNGTTEVFAGNSFSVQSHPDKQVILRLPFTFSWTRSFTFVLDALDVVNNDMRLAKIIERKMYSGIVLPGTDWHTLMYAGSSAKFTYRIRVLCAPNYYNSTCTVLCKPRNDKFGHYTCNEKGEKICLEGWKGSTCEKAICREGCDPIHGFCEVPNECSCRHGWSSDLCNECVPYPGCKHGYCNETPWQCICDENWGGIMCDQDLNYCGHHRPCTNFGMCKNVAPDSYRCVCPVGFSGKNCEIADNPCLNNPCLNNGICSELNGTAICECKPGWIGDRCEIDINECESSPCANGGTCVDLVNNFQCLCTPGWEGVTCQEDADECKWSPCVNAVRCHNHEGDYECICQDGWKGKNCTENINDCIGHCQNGANCLDLINDYHCACLPGFTGRDCQTNINECASNPCINGGECVDLIYAFRCICPVGYRGQQCEIDIDLCNPNPCKNNAACFNMNRDYYCHCPEKHFGKNCSHKLDDCNSEYCDNFDSCIAVIGTNASHTDIIKTNVCGEHGKCISEPYSDFSCVCDPGYTGRYCHENINDCASYPCRNGGTCVDGVNSYHCLCREGWEGKHCLTEKDECKSNPCLNNGTCIDAEAGFWCECKNGWKGKTCNLKHGHCDTNTCQNGGTCLDVGDSFHCTCIDGWVGHSCHIYVDDCQSNPCFNDGHCIDGDNWFMCECAPGFTGPDCRINVNECHPNPCSNGATCMDGINDYKCFCPPHKTGKRCETDVKRSCEFQGAEKQDGSQWQFECNTCLCQDGKVICSRAICEQQICEYKAKLQDHSRQCLEGHVCIPLFSNNCFTLPCSGTGRCLSKLNAHSYVAAHIPLQCKASKHSHAGNCAKLSVKYLEEVLQTLVVNTDDVCFEIQKFIWGLDFVDMPVFAQCDIEVENEYQLEITISTELEATKEIQSTLQRITEKIKDMIRRKKLNTIYIESIQDVEIKSDKNVEIFDESKYLIPFCITLLIALIVLLIIGVLLYKQKKLSRNDSSTSPISEEKHGNNRAYIPKEDNKDNWNKYYNNVRPTEEDLSHKNEMIINDEPCTSIPCNPFIEKSYKNLSLERVNQASSLPYKNNLHKEMNVMNFKDCFPEQGVVV